MRRAKRYKLPLHERWSIQKEIIGVNDKLVSTVILANIVADKLGWPKIEHGQPRYRDFAKQYLLKYTEISKVPLSNPKSWVYFIVCGGSVKIGVSDDVESRLASLQTANPAKLKLKAKIGVSGRREAFDLEKKIHEKFSSYHVRGEWYSSRALHQLGKLPETVEWFGGSLSNKALFSKIEKSKGKPLDQWGNVARSKS